MSLTTTTVHGYLFGLDLMGWPDDVGRETASMTLTAQLQALGADQVRALHASLVGGGWQHRPELARQVERMARDRGLSVYPRAVDSACSVGLFPTRGDGAREPATFH